MSLSLINFVFISVFSVEDDNEAENKTAPFKIYIGYANNPWGASTELEDFTQSR